MGLDVEWGGETGNQEHLRRTVESSHDRACTFGPNVSDRLTSPSEELPVSSTIVLVYLVVVLGRGHGKFGRVARTNSSEFMFRARY